MNIEKFSQLLHHVYALGTTRGDYIPVLAWGESGVGKSESVHRVSKELGIDFIDLRLGQMEIGDLIGLPREEAVYPCVYDVEDGGEGASRRYTKQELLQRLLERWADDERVSEDRGSALRWAIELANKRYPHLVDIHTNYAKPSWFPEPGTSGFLFLDELNRSHLEVRQAVFQLLLDRRMHTHKLPDGWIIISAVNPATEDYQTEDLYDKAFLARFLHVAFEPSRNEWLEYASRTNVDWSIRALISEDGRFLGNTAVSIHDKIRPTPRSWVLLDKILVNIPDTIEEEVAMGLVGPEAATAWLKLRASTDRPVKAEEVLRDYDKVRGRVKAYAAPKSNRTDLLKVTLDDLAAISEERDLTDDEFEGLVRCTMDCPRDLAYAYLKFRFIRNPRLRHKLSARDDLYDFVASINKESGL